MFVNPAATSGLKHGEAYFGYTQMFAGLNGVGSIGQGLLTAGFPTPFGTLSLGVADFKADSLLEERILGFSFSRRIGAIDAGVTAKYLYHRYLIGGDALAAADPTFQQGASRGALSLDGGFIASLGDSWKVAMAVRNINQPDVGVSAVDRVPRQIQGGVAYEIHSWQTRLTADLIYQANAAGDFNSKMIPSIGLEKRYESVRFRAGATPTQFSAGIGVDWGNFGFDYAFVMTRGLTGDNLGSHSVGLRYRFGGGLAHAAKMADEPAASRPVQAPDDISPAPIIKVSEPVGDGPPAPTSRANGEIGDGPPAKIPAVGQD